VPEHTPDVRSDIDRYLAHAGKIRIDDVPWAEGARVGLTDDEVFTLTYFADIEGQTLRYLKQLMTMQDAFDEEVTAFLTTWNYEEFFHGHALGRLLTVTGHARTPSRAKEVQGATRINERLERLAGPLFARVFARQFPAVYLTFGAVQELTTLRGYESIAAHTKNPALALLSERIAKQERRHFAWYFNRARSELAAAKSAQRLTRFVLRHNWVPVGAGVKSDAEVRRLFKVLFPDNDGGAFASAVDAKIGSLPGLGGVRLLTSFLAEEIALEERTRWTRPNAGAVPHEAWSRP
jgi:rubrerythrin